MRGGSSLNGSGGGGGGGGRRQADMSRASAAATPAACPIPCKSGQKERLKMLALDCVATCSSTLQRGGLCCDGVGPRCNGVVRIATEWSALQRSGSTSRGERNPSARWNIGARFDVSHFTIWEREELQRNSAVLFTLRYFTVLCSTLQYSAVLCGTFYSAVLCGTLYSAVLLGTLRTAPPE
jgi:hypothetical protein